MKHNVTKKIIHYLLTLVFLLGIDMVWINFVAMRLYQEALSDILRPQPLLWAAALAWLLIPLGIVVFVVPMSKSGRQSLFYGGIYGLILYGVYDLTNYSVLQPYTLKMALLDIAWGTLLCGISATFSWWLSKYFAD
jgi:uncharacterized membrane protein